LFRSAGASYIGLSSVRKSWPPLSTEAVENTARKCAMGL
jgi:hypothetical protein